MATVFLEVDIEAKKQALQQLEDAVKNSVSAGASSPDAVKFDDSSIKSAGQDAATSYSKGFQDRSKSTFKKITDSFKNIFKKPSQKAGEESGKEYSKGFKSKVKLDGILPKAATVLALTGVITTAASAFDSFNQPFVELEKNVRNIGTLGVENFQEFTDLSLELSKRVPESAAGIANAVYQTVSAGISGTNQEILAFTEQASKVGVAGLASTEDAVNGLTTVLNAYKLNVSDAGTVSDTFFAAIKLGKTSFNEINAALANVVPAASAAGIGFDEVSASIAQMTALGVPTSQASTQMRAAIIELQKPSKGLKDAMDAAGLSVANIGDTLKSQGLIATLQQLEVAAAESGKSMTQVFSSSEAASAALLLTGDNAARATETLANVRKEIEGGASTAAYDIAADSIAVKSQIIANKVQAFFSGVFQTLGSGATTALTAVNQVAPALAGLGGVAAIIPPNFIENVTKYAKSILTFLVPSIATASTTSGAAALSFSSMWAALTAPVTIVIAAIAAVTAALALFFTKTETGRKAWESIKTTVAGLVSSFLEIVSVVKQKLQPVFDALSEYFNELAQVGQFLGSIILELIIAPFEILWSIISTGFSIISSIIGYFADLIGISQGTGSAVEFVSKIINNFTSGLKVLKAILGGVTSLIRFLKDSFLSLVEGLKNPVQLLKDFVSGFGDFGERAKAAFSEGFNNVKFQDIIKQAFAPVEGAITDEAEKSAKAYKEALEGSTPDISKATDIINQSAQKQIQIVKDAESKVLSNKNITEEAKLELAARTADLLQKIESDKAERLASINQQIAEKEIENDKKVVASTQAKAKKQQESALKILQADRDRLNIANELLASQEENQRRKEGLVKTSQDELKEEQRKLTTLETYKKSLQEAIKLGQVQNKNGNVVKVDSKEIKSELDKVENDIKKTQLSVERITIDVDINDRKAKEQLKEIQLETLKLEIQLGKKTDADLLKRLKTDAQALNNEINNPKINETQRQQLINEKLKLALEIQQLELKISEDTEAKRLNNIVDFAARERAIKLSELKKQFDEEINQVGLNEERKLQITKAYNQQRNDVIKESIIAENSLAGVLTRSVESVMQAINNAQPNRARINQINEEIEAIDQRADFELSALEKGEISYNNYIDKLNKIDEERLAKQKELGNETVSFWDSVNKGISETFTAVSTEYTNYAKEEMKNFFEFTTDESGNMTGGFTTNMDSITKATQNAGVAAAASFGQMLAEGENAMSALSTAVFNTAVEMAQSMMIEFAPVIFTQATKFLGPIAGPIAAIAGIATVTALISSLKAKAQPRYTGGWVDKEGIYTVAERGPEYVMNNAASVKNEPYLKMMNKGMSFEQIANSSVTNQNLVSSFIQQSNEIKRTQEFINKINHDFNSKFLSIQSKVSEVTESVFNKIYKIESKDSVVNSAKTNYNELNNSVFNKINSLEKYNEVVKSSFFDNQKFETEISKNDHLEKSISKFDLVDKKYNKISNLHGN
jgi:TP901 family phage tail tape measure protein